MKKNKERALSRRYRAQGKSIKSIAVKLGVSTSSVSVWTRDVILSAQQRQDLDNNNPVINSECGKTKSGRTRSKLYRYRRLLKQSEGRKRAQMTNDVLHRSGSMLYWAEGNKSRNALRFCNSDSDMISFFLRFLRECFQISDDEVTLYFNCYLNNGLSLKQIQQFWLDKLKLPSDCLRSAITKQGSSSGGKHKYGICTLCVNRTDVLQHIYGAIQEYAQFDRQDWVD